MEGVDIYDPVTNNVVDTGAAKVAAWFVDGDYDGRTFCITQAFFPDRSAWEKLSKALDGVVDPTLKGRSEALTQLTGFEQNLAAYLADCMTRTTCTLARAGDPRVKLVAVMNRLDATPLPVGNRQLTRSLAMMAVLATMYDQPRWKDLDGALAALDGGDGGKMLAIADHWNERNPDGTYGNLVNGAFAATACIEGPQAPTEILAPDPVAGQILRASPFFGAWEEWHGVYCDFWPELPRAYQPLTISGAPPILLVGASNDPATPYVWSKNVSEQILRSVLLTRVGAADPRGQRPHLIRVQ